MLIRRNERKRSLAEEPNDSFDMSVEEKDSSRFWFDEKPLVQSSSMPELKISDLALDRNKSTMKLNDFEEYK